MKEKLINTSIATALISLWLILGYIGAGWAYADQLHMFPYLGSDEHDRAQMRHGAVSFALLGPITFGAAFLFTGWGEYGWIRPDRDTGPYKYNDGLYSRAVHHFTDH